MYIEYEALLHWNLFVGVFLRSVQEQQTFLNLKVYAETLQTYFKNAWH
jgi:hypothetical protein